jgi:hypothetical protein
VCACALRKRLMSDVMLLVLSVCCMLYLALPGVLCPLVPS